MGLLHLASLISLVTHKLHLGTAGEFPPFLGDSKMGEQKLLGLNNAGPNKEQLQ